MTFNLESGEFHRTAGGLDFEWATAPWPYRSPAGTAMFELYLNVAERNGGLLCELDHSEIFDPETARRWLGHFRTLLEQIVENPDRPVSELSLLDAAEKSRVTEEWNATARPYPAGTRLHRMVEQQVERTPGCGGGVASAKPRLTYRELNAQANRSRITCATLGVGRDMPVACAWSARWPCRWRCWPC